MRAILFCFMSCACFILLTALFPSTNPKVVQAIRGRSPVKPKPLDQLVMKYATALSTHLSLDEIKKVKLESNLLNTNNPSSPQMFHATAIVKGGLIGGIMLMTFPLFGSLSFFWAGAMGLMVYRSDFQTLHKQVQVRKETIEKELPQFSGTIRQALSNSRSIVVILRSYRKVCGVALQEEIDKTLNDIKLGNEEKALKDFERRIGSAKVSELVRGLISVVKGEDQRLYFEMLTMEYIKLQNENIRRELLSRPAKLFPYMLLLFFCMLAMYGVSIAIYAMDQFAILW